MGTAVIPGRDTSPVLQPAECIFNKIPLLIQRVVKGKCFISVFRVACDRHPSGFQEIQATTLRRSPSAKNVLLSGRKCWRMAAPLSSLTCPSVSKAGQDAHARHKQYGIWNSGQLLFVL